MSTTRLSQAGQTKVRTHSSKYRFIAIQSSQSFSTHLHHFHPHINIQTRNIHHGVCNVQAPPPPLKRFVTTSVSTTPPTSRPRAAIHTHVSHNTSTSRATNLMTYTAGTPVLSTLPQPPFTTSTLLSTIKQSPYTTLVSSFTTLYSITRYGNFTPAQGSSRQGTNPHLLTAAEFSTQTATTTNSRTTATKSSADNSTEPNEDESEPNHPQTTQHSEEPLLPRIASTAEPAQPASAIVPKTPEQIQLEADIIEVIETKIADGIRADGGDIHFIQFIPGVKPTPNPDGSIPEAGTEGSGTDGVVEVALSGACDSCDRSAITLQILITGALKFYFPGVVGKVRRVYLPQDGEGEGGESRQIH